MKPYEIFAVDDEPLNLKIFKIIFEDKNDFHLTTATSGEEAWQILSSNKSKYDLFLVDRMMPEMSGDQLIELIRTEARFYGVPVFMITAKSSNEDIVEGISLGADQYITKPFDNDILYEWCKSAILEFNQHKQELEKLKKMKSSNHNKSAHIEFVTGSANCKDYHSLIQYLFRAIKMFQFEKWEPLRVSILLKVNNQEIGHSDKTLDLNKLEETDQIILRKALKEFYVEPENSGNDNAIYTAWANVWNLEEPKNLEGIAILVRNFPSLNIIDQNLLQERKRLQEEIQEVIGVILERFAEVIQRIEFERKLQKGNETLIKQRDELEKTQDNMRKIVESSVKAFEKINEKYQFMKEAQMNLWEELEQSCDSSSKTKIISSMNNAFDLFGEEQLVDQEFLKAMRALKALFIKHAESSEADAIQIGGKQENVNDLLSQFGM